MRNFGISFLILLALLLTTKAYADEREVSSENADVSTPAELVQSCLEQAALGDGDRTSCIGISVSPCTANALTTVEMLSCLTPEIAVWESRMNAGLKALDVTYAEQDEFEDPVRALGPRLLVYQEQWLAWRDAKCGFEHDTFRGGSLGRIAGADCRLELTAKRVLELEDLAEEASY